MKRKAHEDEQEPLLTAVARKLGQAAGTLANMTHLLTPDTVAKLTDSSSPSAPATPQSGQASSKVESSPNAGRTRKTKVRRVNPRRRTRLVSAGSRAQKTSTTKNKASGRKKR